MATAAVATSHSRSGDRESGAELFIGRRALNKIMVHADYASAETCLPQPLEGSEGAGWRWGPGQDYCGHVAEPNRTEQNRQHRGICKVDLSKWR